MTDEIKKDSIIQDQIILIEPSKIEAHIKSLENEGKIFED